MQRLITILTVLFATATVFAGARDTGGGDEVLLDVQAILTKIKNECESWPALKSAAPDLPARVRTLIEDIQGEQTKQNYLRIEDQVALADQKPRAGRFRIDFDDPSLGRKISDITLSRSYWLMAKDDSKRKIGIVLHELLGLLEVEKSDDYHISSLVVFDLREDYHRRWETFAGKPIGTLTCEARYSCAPNRGAAFPTIYRKEAGKRATVTVSPDNLSLVIQPEKKDSCIPNDRMVVIDSDAIYLPHMLPFAEISTTLKKTGISRDVEWSVSYLGSEAEKKSHHHHRSVGKFAFGHELVPGSIGWIQSSYERLKEDRSPTPSWPSWKPIQSFDLVYRYCK